MKKSMRSMAGVTLLEIMLVLAVAAMIIVMSVRYYQSASASQQATSAFQQIQAITAAADALSQGKGDYTLVTTASITPLLSNAGGLKTPWGSDITITPAGTSYTVNIPEVPTGVCGLISGRLVGNDHIAITGNCQPNAKSNFSYTYTLNP